MRRIAKRAVLLALPAAGCLAWMAFVDPPASAPGTPADDPTMRLDIVFPVKVTVVHRGTFVTTVSASGILRACREAEIIPRVSGQVIAVNGFEGMSVKRGEVLATIDDREFRLALDRASSALLTARIEYKTLSTSPFLRMIDTALARRHLADARQELAIAESGYAAGTTGPQTLTHARRNYEVAKAYFSVDRGDIIANRSGLTQAKEAYERARLDIAGTVLRAPFAGMVASWDLSAGSQARPGRAVCTIVDVSTLLFDAEIIEGDAGSIHTGQSASASFIACPEISIQGRVRTLSPVIDARTKMMKATIELSAGGLPRAGKDPVLRPGMYGTVRIETGRKPDRLLVPREAILVRDQRPLVFTVESGRASWHYVTTGEENREQVEIQSGIAEGDTVITEGHYTLAHSARVHIE